MKILLVNYRYFISGGPERYMFNIKKVLEDNGHEVFPFSVHSNKNLRTAYSKYFVTPIGANDAIYYDDVKRTPKTIWQLLTRSIYSFEVKRAIQREIRDLKPDIVYILHFVNKLSPSVITGAKELGIPVILRLSDYFLLCPRFDFLYNKEICEDCLTKGYRSCIKKRCIKESLWASLIRVIAMKIHKILRIYDRVDAFITPSEFLKQKMANNGFPIEKIHCIPTFTSMRDTRYVPPIGTYGLYFGRITKDKGVETIIKAYEKMPTRQLKIVGDATTKEGVNLREYVRQNRLLNIEFLGFKEGIDLDDIIRRARFTIIPSIWYDNLPNTALEAFQQSKAVIASNLGSLPELVTDGFNGYLFEPGNADDLCEKIQCLDDDEKVKIMGINSRCMIEKKFHAEVHYEKLLNVFNTLTIDSI